MRSEKEYHRRKAAKESEKEYKKSKTFRVYLGEPLTAFSGILAAATLFLVIVGMFQYLSLNKKVLDAEIVQRPWISVSIVTTGPYFLKINDGKLAFTVNYHVKNVGKLPATRVFFYTTLVSLTSSAEIANAEMRACDYIINRMNHSATSAGITLFPDETGDSSFVIDDAGTIAEYPRGKDGLSAILVPVCTPYQFADGGDEFHVTPEAYVLVQRTADKGLKGIDLTAIPKEGIAVEIHRMAQGSVPPS